MIAKLNLLDRFALAVSPQWGSNRIRARLVADTMARHYEAASVGRRTANWPRSGADANAANGPSLAALRSHARDLVRNNAWARKALRVIATHTVGWGITAKAVGEGATPELAELWKRWAESKECDADGRRNLYAIQSLAMRTIAESGEVLIRRRRRRADDGLAIPLQLQVLEPDFIDITRDGFTGVAGGPVIQGVEYDKLGKRAAYWLFDQHPGSAQSGAATSRRIPADDVLHVFFEERAGQVRGVSWLAVAVLNLRDFDEYEDATLMRQKIAACFAAFVTNADGDEKFGGDEAQDPIVDTLEPGMVVPLPAGKEITFSNPPVTGEDGFSVRTLRRIAAGIGVTYEDMTGDYSQVNFSSARMSRIEHWGYVHDWRWLMLVPQLCDGIWAWATEAAEVAGLVKTRPSAEWTAPPMPMLEPDREGLALTRLVRAGAMTPDEMVRERGYDPEKHWDEYAANLARLDKLGIWLDSDVRRTSQAGLTQERVGGGGDKPSEVSAEEGG